MLFRRRITRVLLFALVPCIVSCGGCASLEPPKITADTSTPKAAAMAYLRAIAAGDSRTAMALSTGDGAQKEWVVGRAVLVDGMRKFDDALLARFGNKSSQLRTDLRDSLLKLSDMWITSIGDGTVNADDENARIDPKRVGFFTRFINPVYLHHEKAGWRVLLASTYPGGGTTEADANIAGDYRAWRKFGEGFAAVAKEIRVGKYRTEEQADQALLARLSTLQASN